jgi:hypothetical protein
MVSRHTEHKVWCAAMTCINALLTTWPHNFQSMVLMQVWTQCSSKTLPHCQALCISHPQSPQQSQHMNEVIMIAGCIMRRMTIITGLRAHKLQKLQYQLGFRQLQEHSVTLCTAFQKLQRLMYMR